ncbi:MAG: potassium transporter TrkG [Clostridia bacterium]
MINATDTMAKKKPLFSKIKDNMTPARVILLGFLGIITVGMLLLMLPISSKSGKCIGFVNSLFMATSAVCVTGLAVVDPATQLTIFGQVVLLLLIQVGGLGFMTTTTLMFLLIGKKISLRERLAIQENLSQDNLKGVVKLTKRVLIFTFVVEGIGALILLFKFVPMMGFGRGLYVSVFTAISAFCNAGLDILGMDFGAYSSLAGIYSSPIPMLTIAGLIIVGGLGFMVFADIYGRKKNRRLALHTKVAIGMTAALLAIGTIFFFAAEYYNPLTLGKMSFGDKLVNAFFQSTTARTAGFSSVNQGDLTEGSKLITIMLMFVGASPASTGGGIKTTTLFVMIMVLIATLRDADEVVVGKQTITRKTTRKVVTIIMVASALVLLQTTLLWLVEGGDDDSALLSYIFESVSAFATVGLSTGITPTLHIVSKISLCATMFIGRVGVLTLGMAIMQKARKDNVKIKYPDAKILIG